MYQKTQNPCYSTTSHKSILFLPPKKQFSIRHLIRRESSPPVKEVIQTSCLQQCGLQATSAEQYVTIEIPQELIREYLSQGYTHLHLGAIRMILTLHGRKGLPVTAKIALLDTTFKEYQHALIGALVSTLTNGSVILTISPDFTIRLIDPTLSQRIRIQIQLIGVTQDASAEQATLHHQVLYRIQDHALDLNLPNTTHDALLMFTDKNHGPAIVNIPRMIPPDELAAIVPLEWITNYERAFPQSTLDVQTTSPPVVTRETDGTVRTVFQRPGTERRPSFSRQSSSRRIYMISPLTVQHTSNQDDPPIHYYEEGKPVYVSHVNGHFIWDVDHNMCDSDCDCDAWGESEDEDYYKKKKSKKNRKQSCTAPPKFYPPDEPEEPPKFYLRKKKKKILRPQFSDPIAVPCIATLKPYEQEFPPLQVSTDSQRITRRPYIAPRGVTPQGVQSTSPQDEVLNWQTENAVSQNKVLLRIDHTLETLVEKTDNLSSQVYSVQTQVEELKNRLTTQAQNSTKT
ncbi:polyprotein [Arachis hypogaea]|nr:polyprotein [Arachis hypogaea]